MLDAFFVPEIAYLFQPISCHNLILFIVLVRTVGQNLPHTETFDRSVIIRFIEFS